MPRRSSASRSTKPAPSSAAPWLLAAGAAALLLLLALPALLATRRPAFTPGENNIAPAIAPAPASRSLDDLTALAPSVQPPLDRTRAIKAWELSDSDRPEEAARQIHAILREEKDDAVRCEILGAASTLEATPALRAVFEEYAKPAHSSRVRQVALDLWLTVFPDEASRIARTFLRDSDEEVQGIAEEYFLTRRDEAREKPVGE